MNGWKESPLNPKTRMKTIAGATVAAGQTGITRTQITVRVTHDERGKTLSLEDGKIMLLIPLEPVTDMIDTTF